MSKWGALEYCTVRDNYDRLLQSENGAEMIFGNIGPVTPGSSEIKAVYGSTWRLTVVLL